MTDTTDTETQETVTEGIESLSDIFDDSKESETVETEEETEEEKGETEEEETEEKSEESETKEAETPSAEIAGQTAALVAERKKRQALEVELKQYREGKKMPDPVDDPEGYAAHVQSMVSQETLRSRISISRNVLMDVKEDYLDKEKVFQDLIGAEYDDDGKITSLKDEALHRKFLQSENPAKFAYDTAKEHLEIQQLKDPAYIQKIKDEAREEGRKAALSEKQKLSATQVPDLTKATESGKNSKKVETLPEIDEIFADSKL